MHNTSGETLASDTTPYPWELEWENQKIYTFEPGKKEEEEEEEVKEVNEVEDLTVMRGDKIDIEKEEEEDVVVKEEDKEKAKIEKVEEENQEQEESCKNDLRLDNEDDLDYDDGQEGETCLKIFIGEEEEEEEEEEEDDEEEVKVKEEEQKRQQKSPVAKVDCNDIISDSDNAADRDSKKESEQEEELVICDSEIVSTSLHNSPVNSEVNVLDHPSESWTSCGEHLFSRFSEQSHSPDIVRTPSNISKHVISPNFESSGNNSFRQINSPSLKIVTDRTDKDKKRERTERDYKKKSERIKDKERGRDREKEDRPPKKLKIKLKSEERALVPPLRIRTEERGVGLKLTLKKQEGSGAYYSVGEERKREYRVEQNEAEDDDDDDIVGMLEGEEEEEEEEEDGDPDGHGLKEVKVILQDVLKDKRFKKQIEERSSKKRRREKGDDRSERNDKYNSHWSNHSQQLHQSEGDKKCSQPSNHDNRNWNYNSGAEWRRSGGEGASSVDHSSDHRTREYNPRLYTYNDHFGHEYSSRHNHPQSYGHSGSQPRNSHTYY